jgi:hypothetical protein
MARKNPVLGGGRKQGQVIQDLVDVLVNACPTISGFSRQQVRVDSDLCLHSRASRRFLNSHKRRLYRKRLIEGYPAS